MMNAYDPLYLEKGRTTLGCMLHYAAHGIHMPLHKYYPLFLATGVADRFGSGEVSLLAGSSGIELVHCVLEHAGIPRKHATQKADLSRSKEYWAGWALGYYQWKSGKRFADIEARVPIDRIRQMYSPYHEMDILHFVDALDAQFREIPGETALARLRKYADLSQRMLAERSGVPLRTIQQYEQRQKELTKAGSAHILHLARALHTSPEALLDI